MVRSFVRLAVIATLITGGFFVTSSPASAAHTCATGLRSPSCKNPQRTGPNRNNPRGGGLPALPARDAVCDRGRHRGNPHCFDAPRVVDRKVEIQGRTVRRVTAPRSNRAAAPRAGTRVVSRAGSSL